MSQRRLYDQGEHGCDLPFPFLLPWESPHVPTLLPTVGPMDPYGSMSLRYCLPWDPWIPTVLPTLGPTHVPTVLPAVGPMVLPTIGPTVLPTGGLMDYGLWIMDYE
jgi:hypothetical protein